MLPFSIALISPSSPTVTFLGDNAIEIKNNCNICCNNTQGSSRCTHLQSTGAFRMD